MFGDYIINKLQMWNINRARIYNLWGIIKYTEPEAPEITFPI